jgi:dTDP-4-amino-4,6-dideoxygalactose transaminase
VDVERDTLGLDPARLPAALGPRTRSILAVHQIGIPCAIEPIADFARAQGLPLIEDAACAVGSEHRVGGAWQAIGAPVGEIACFSFHPRKVLTTGDGGMITTRSADLDRRFRLLRQHAMSVTDAARHGQGQVVFEEYLEPAFNARLTDLQAAVGRPQLARLRAIVDERRALAGRLTGALASHRVLAPLSMREDARPNFQSYAALLREGSGWTQRGLLEFLLARGIAGKRGITNAHQEPAYRGRDNHRLAGPLDVSEWLRDHTVLLPLFNGMLEEEVAAVLDALAALDGARPA